MPLVVDSAPNGMLMIDKDGAIVLVNTQIEKVFGYRREELIGKPVETLVPSRIAGPHPGIRVSFFAAPQVRAMGAGETSFGLRRRGEFPVEIGLNPIEMAGGTASVVDITERKQAEDRLRQSEERFRSMIENVRDYAILMLDTKGRVVTWNKGAERVKGYQLEEIIGKHFSCFFPIEDRESGKPEQMLKVALAQGQYEDEGCARRARTDPGSGPVWFSRRYVPLEEDWSVFQRSHAISAGDMKNLVGRAESRQGRGDSERGQVPFSRQYQR